MKIKFIEIILFIIIMSINVETAVLKIENWHDSKLTKQKNVLINNFGEMGLKIVNIPDSVNKRASCGNCHEEREKITSVKTEPKEHKMGTLLIPTDNTIAQNILARKNGGRLEFITSEYAKDFSNGPYQAAFLNDSLTDSRRNPEFGNQPSFWGCDMLTKWKEPFPQEFVYSFKDNKKYIIDTFVLYNAAGGDADGFDTELKNFSLYVNSDPITSDDIYNVTDDGGGWSYNNSKFSYLSPSNVLGDGLFPSFQEPLKYKFETWIQSKNLEYTINSGNPKFVRLDFKKPTTISSIFITSDDSANVHNLETDMYKVKIVVITPKGEKVVYDNSKNQIVEDEFTKGYSAYFDPIEATGVIVKFYTEKYVEWQKILIFKKPWKKVLSARAMQKFKDYSPEVFYFTPTEAQYLRVSLESNYGNPKWVDIGEMEVYNSYPKNIASYENGARVLDCNRVDSYIFGPNRLLDGKLLGDDEYSINKKNYVFAVELEMTKRKTEDENDIKIILDLGKESVFGQINHYNTGDSGARSVIIYYSLDNERWDELGVCERLNFSERDLPNKDTFIFPPIRARYIKFRYLSSSWLKNKLRISEYEIFEVKPQYTKEGGFITQVYDLNAPSLFEKLIVNEEGFDKVSLNTEIKLTVTSDKVADFTQERHVSTYIIKPNEASTFRLAEVHNGDRYIQYKVLLTTKDVSTTPIIKNIIIEYRSLEEVFAEGKKYEDEKSYKQAQEIFEKIELGKYDPDYTLKAQQGLVRIKDTINSEANKLLEEGNKLYAKNQFDGAIEVYRDVLRRYPDARMDDIINEKIKDSGIGKEFDIGESLVQKRKYWKAVEQYKAIIDNYPKTEWAKKSKKALDEYFEMEAQEVSDNAKKLLNNKQFDEAQILFLQIKEKYAPLKWQQSAQEGIALCVKGKAEASLAEAQNLFKNKNFEEALAMYKKVIMEYPDTESAKIADDEINKTQDKILEAKFNAALKIKDSKKYQQAIKAFEEVIALAITSNWKNKATNEIKDCEKNIYDNKVADAKKIYDEAVFLFKKEEIDKAYDIFEKVTKEYKGTAWDIESQKFVDEIRAKRIDEEIAKALKEGNYFEVIANFEELKKISVARELVAKVNTKLNKNIPEIYESGKRYTRDKEYKKAYKIYDFIKVNYPNSEWSDRIMERLRQVEEKLKE